jgi:hypothetical protein
MQQAQIGQEQHGSKISRGLQDLNKFWEAYNSGLYHLKEECTKGVIKRPATVLPEWLDQLT